MDCQGYAAGHVPLQVSIYWLQKQNFSWRISFFIAEFARGFGYGARGLALCIERLREKMGESSSFYADVKSENAISREVFLKLEFSESICEYGYRYELRA